MLPVHRGTSPSLPDAGSARHAGHTHLAVTCCWEWALGRSLWGWAPTSELGTSGDV